MTAHPDTHPTIRKLMEPYYKQFDKISGNMICNAAGIHINDLNLRGACLHHILGGCVGSCERRHPQSSEAKPEQVQLICNKLRPGIGKLTSGEENAQKRRGRGRFQRS